VEDAIAQAHALFASRGWSSRIPQDMREALFAELRWRRYEPDETITLGGSIGGSFCALAAGQVGAIAALGEPGSGVSHIMTPGWWWGAAPLLGRARALDGVARTPALVGHIPLTQLERLLDATPGWWRWLGALSEEWVAMASVAFADMTITDKRRRCAAQMLRLAGLRPPLCAAADIAIQISHSEVAHMVALSRTTTSEVLRDLEKLELIELGYRSVRVRDWSGLQSMVDG
jgi:CRP-like cAMP-binding protein